MLLIDTCGWWIIKKKEKHYVILSCGYKSLFQKHINECINYNLCTSDPGATINLYNMNFVLAINSKENVHQEILLHNRINVINEIVQVASFGLPILNFLA